MCSICVVWNWSFHQTLIRDLKLRRLMWYSDSEYVSRKSHRVLHAALRYQWWEIRSYLHSASIYYFTFKGRHLGDNPWAGLGSDMYLMWSEKHRFVWHLHKRWWSRLWLWITELNGVVYRVKSNGPKTEPWGTPQEVGSMSEKQLPVLMACRLSVRYEVNQLRDVVVNGVESGG